MTKRIPTTVQTKPTTSPSKQVAAFIAKFDPAIAKLVRAARTLLRKRYPTAIEIVYDNYNALAIGYSSTERTSDVLFSLAVYARGVNLSVLNQPDVKALMRAAVTQADPPLPLRGRGRTIIKSISAKQRPRR
jgi:hypothetical protein